MTKCRACLALVQNLVPFDNTSIENYNLLTCLDIKATDGLPQALCEQCYNTMETFVMFRLNCINSEEILKTEYVNSRGICEVINGANNEIKQEVGRSIDDAMEADNFMAADDGPPEHCEDVLKVKDEDIDADEMEDSKWEDITELPDGLINDIQLSDAVLKFDDTSESDSDEDSGDEQAKEPHKIDIAKKKGEKKRNLHQLTSATWVVKEFPVVEYKLLQPSYRPNFAENFELNNYFQQYIDDEFIATIVSRTNRSYRALYRKRLNLTSEEFRHFMGMTFIMAAIKNLSLKDFWEQPFGIPIIMNTMSRNRYVTIRNSFELISEDDVTDDELKKDKLWKLRPLIERIQRGCRSQEKDQHLSVDEMIIPFTGYTPIKPYRPNERNAVGLKAFVMFNPDGLITDIEIYQGKSTFPDLQDTVFTIREKAVLSMADSLVPGHVLYFDRYFTTEKLAIELANRGIGCTGLMRRSALPANAKGKILSDVKLKKNGKGAIHCVVNDTNNIAITKWFDKKVVTFLSTVEANDPIDKHERWSSNHYKVIFVRRPTVARNYQNYFVGSEETADTLSQFPNKHRSKSCTLRFFFHMLDLAVCNSWLQYKKVELEKGVDMKKIKEFQLFKMKLGEILITGEALSDETDDYSSSDESTSSYEMPILERRRNA